MKGRIALKVSAQDKRIDEETDQVLYFDTIASGDGRPDDDVLLCRISMEKRLKRGQQGYEQGYPFLPAQSTQSIG